MITAAAICGRPLRYHELNRPRAWYDPEPVCGRPAGHGAASGCLSRETYARRLERRRVAEAARRGLADPEATA